MDPADEFHNPYGYVGNHPVNRVDPDGSETLYTVAAEQMNIGRFTSQNTHQEYRDFVNGGAIALAVGSSFWGGSWLVRWVFLNQITVVVVGAPLGSCI